MQHQLVVGVLPLGRQLGLQRRCALFQAVPGGRDPLGLAIVHQAEGVGPDQFGLAPGVVLGVTGHQIGDLGGVLGAELARGPAPRPRADVVLAEGRRVPRQAQEEFDRHLQRLEVADVGDPDLVGAVRVRQVHLFPDFRQWIAVEPLVRERPAIHVHVKIDAGAAGAGALGRRGQAAQVADIVVGEEQGDVVRHLEAGVVVFLDLGEQGPQLRHLALVDAALFRDDLLLVADDLLDHFLVRFQPARVRHGDVAVAAHAHRHDAFIGPVAAHAVGEEAFEAGLVAQVIPFAVAVILAVRGPLLVRPYHRFVVAGAHDDAVGVGQARVVRVVLVEGAAPHRRPQVVGAQAQQQLEHVRIHLGVEAAEFRARPAGQRRFLVVDEDAPVLDGRRPLHPGARQGVQRRPVAGRDVGPPMPRRHADLFGDLVDAVDGAALVAAGDHQGPFDARDRLFNGGDHE